RDLNVRVAPKRPLKVQRRINPAKPPAEDQDASRRAFHESHCETRGRNCQSEEFAPATPQPARPSRTRDNNPSWRAGHTRSACTILLQAAVADGSATEAARSVEELTSPAQRTSKAPP